MRLIDADELIYGLKTEFGQFAMTYILAFIKAQPTVDPVKHGHWIHGSSSENIRVTCSECGYKVNYFWDSWQDAKYCPNCGAKMLGMEK